MCVPQYNNAGDIEITCVSTASKCTVNHILYSENLMSYYFATYLYPLGFVSFSLVSDYKVNRPSSLETT